MVQKLFLWFYCLSITDAVILVVLASMVFLFLRRRLCQKRFWLPAAALLLLAWLAVIAAATLTDRIPGAVPAKPELLPFHSYRAVMAGGNREILRSNFMNVLLFYPTGLLACELLPKRWSRMQRILLVTGLALLASAGIEFCQYRYALGQAETDDVIHNVLGALLGALVCTLPLQSKSEKHGQA